MYWTSSRSGIGIYRSNLDGTNIQHLRTGNSPHLGIAVDTINRKLIWNELGAVRRANLDGSNVQTLLSGDTYQDLALDLTNRTIYVSRWDGVNTGNLVRMSLDGSGQTTLLSNIAIGPNGLALDPVAEKVYFSRFDLSAGSGSVERVDLNGANRQTIIPNLDVDALAVDVSASKLYYTSLADDLRSGDINRANLDGSDAEVFVPLGSSPPAGVTIIPEPACAAYMTMSLFWLSQVHRRRNAPIRL